MRNPRYRVDRAITGEREATSYNNYYEFGFGKTDPAENAGSLTTDPWAVEIGGMVDRPGSYALADIAPANAVEDRIYRLRCVEGTVASPSWRRSCGDRRPR